MLDIKTNMDYIKIEVNDMTVVVNKINKIQKKKVQIQKKLEKQNKIAEKIPKNKSVVRRNQKNSFKDNIWRKNKFISKPQKIVKKKIIIIQKDYQILKHKDMYL